MPDGGLRQDRSRRSSSASLRPGHARPPGEAGGGREHHAHLVPGVRASRGRRRARRARAPGRMPRSSPRARPRCRARRRHRPRGWRRGPRRPRRCRPAPPAITGARFMPQRCTQFGRKLAGRARCLRPGAASARGRMPVAASAASDQSRLPTSSQSVPEASRHLLDVLAASAAGAHRPWAAAPWRRARRSRARACAPT